MSKLFICDNCSKEYRQPLDEETYKDVSGVWHTFDLCAPCRKKLKDIREEANSKFLEKMAKK